MIRQAAWILVIFVALFSKDTASWSLSIYPEAGHIRVNKSTTIYCRSHDEIDECLFKIDDRKIMDFSLGSNSRSHSVTNKKGLLYRASYVSSEQRRGHCVVTLSNMAAGVYIVGCQLRKNGGSVRVSYMPLTVDDSYPLRLKVNRKYQVAAPGSNLDILCSTGRSQPITTCALRLPSQQWVTFPNGHLSKETDRYHYHGRGLENGHCGITLLNVGPEDSGLYMCQVKAGEKSAVHATVVKVARLNPETEISCKEKPHHFPGDSLDADCVMRGAYPLPPMVWTYQTRVLRSSDIDETVNDKREFKWPWEDQVMRQKLTFSVGDEIGDKNLKCEAGELEVEPGWPIVSKFSKAVKNQIKIPIHPKCGRRTNSTYNTAYRRKTITKRHVSTRAAGVSSSKLTTTRPKSQFSYDYVDPVWDETVPGNHRGPPPLFPTPLPISPPAPIAGGLLVFNGKLNANGDLTGPTDVLHKSDNDPEIEFETFPWTTAVYRKIKEEYMQICGGTLVTETYVISAAHCFYDDVKSKANPPSDYWVALGKIYRDWNRVDGSVQKRELRHLHLHPAYRGRKRNYQHDIAVMELMNNVVYTPRVAPACLDWRNLYEDRQLVKGSVGLVTGWGYINEASLSEVLRYAELPYVDPNACYDKLPESVQLLMTTDKFCAGFSNSNISVCQGDSGGGLLFQDEFFGTYFLRGVVSLAFQPAEFRGFCYSSQVSGFTSIAHSMVWLKRVMDHS